MSGKLRWIVAASMLAFLGLIVVIEPAREQVFAVHAKALLERMLDAGVAALRDQGERHYRQQRALSPDAPLAGPDEKEPSTAELCLLAAGGPLVVDFVTRTPPVAPRVLARWRESVTSKLEGFGRVEPGATTKLTLSFDPAADRRLVTLALSGPTARRDGPPELVQAALLADFRSILPPFLTILIAVLAGRTILALVCGVVLGGFLYAHELTVLAGAGSFYDEFVTGVRHMGETYVWGNVVSDDFQLNILLFVVFLSMAVGIMAKCGGIEGMVQLVRRWAKTARSSQVVTWIMGLLVFFDDYANTIVVGSTMRPLTDRLKVSREKLAYIVDSTAAPVAGISMLSTWVAYEVSTFAPSLPEVTDAAGNAYEVKQGFEIFLATIPYRFYCLLTLCMVLLTIVLRREFGPMLRAERRARHDGKLLADGATPLVSAALTETKSKEGVPARWFNGVLPVLTLLAVTIWVIVQTGLAQLAADGEELEPAFFDAVRQILGAADSTQAIFCGAATAASLAALLAIGQRILNPLETLSTAFKASGALLFAVVILVLAWSVGDICKDELGTAYYLVALTEGRLPPLLLPVILFLLSCLIAFAIGSSWSTMAILLPNVVLLAHAFGEDTALGGPVLMVLSIGAVLEGSIFGDHCSPISDTTVLSSVASASDHMHHVRTQIPYAVLVMVTSMVVGYLPAAFLSPALWPVSLALGVAVIAGFLLLLGRDPETAG